jgi:hypothetical protein
MSIPTRARALPVLAVSALLALAPAGAAAASHSMKHEMKHHNKHAMKHHAMKGKGK